MGETGPTIHRDSGALWAHKSQVYANAAGYYGRISDLANEGINGIISLYAESV